MKLPALRANPLAALFVTFCLLVPVLLAYDHTTPVVFFVIGLIHLLVLGGVNAAKFFTTLSFLSVVSIGLFILNVLFPAEGVDGLSRGIAVFLRSMCLISLSIGYIFVVDPYDLVRSFMMQMKLPPRIGFALFAGWNSIPLLRRDLRIIEKAQAVRFGPRRRKLKDILRTAVVLLAGAVRHGERVSLSMAARGIETAENRTFIKQTRWTRSDTVYCIAGALVSGSAAAFVITSGRFIFELG